MQKQKHSRTRNIIALFVALSAAALPVAVSAQSRGSLQLLGDSQSVSPVRSDMMAGSVGQSVAPGEAKSGAMHPYRMIVKSSTPLLRSTVASRLGDASVKLYALNFGSAETRQYVLSVETTLGKDEVVGRLKSLPGVTFVSEDSLAPAN